MALGPGLDPRAETTASAEMKLVAANPPVAADVFVLLFVFLLSGAWLAHVYPVEAIPEYTCPAVDTQPELRVLLAAKHWTVLGGLERVSIPSTEH
ncbi:hypothetical protein N7491_007040 [Penicillium cf. griseofulvum]|uniref:Uncharacterized protein n=1 Tax=Penicillium cf. griseofulvum TaxID=2972120 RepID=A0A9W9IW40_9EURO|nr:hypothetical protein N7472_009929 [Penicillium cf. griseofulvum]KAJ5430024.1 hypothetical protein N7491_007040 [Penicillium cf. griseofulvum]KAJ5436202.1 hypothetical protein N7445_007087 [Penicillium cf. griseofulvum]